MDTLARYSDRLALLWLLIVGYLSLTPLPQLPEVPGGDKLQHLLSYALLAFLALLARRKPWSLLVTLLLVIAYGGLIELIQPYVNRYGELGDLLANAGGALLGLFAVLILHLPTAAKGGDDGYRTERQQRARSAPPRRPGNET